MLNFALFLVRAQPLGRELSLPRMLRVAEFGAS